MKMRIGQLVGLGERKFSFDLVARKKPVETPAATEEVEPFESLILRRVAPEPEAEVPAALEATDLPAVAPDAVAPDTEGAAADLRTLSAVVEALAPTLSPVAPPAPAPAQPSAAILTTETPAVTAQPHAKIAPPPPAG
ncbi:MAG: hypothetical protein ORN49_10985, partial [Rhodobacteraceae bacterium]|nr:hypothetical protein [Paracoccaceae bacterium]